MEIASALRGQQPAQKTDRTHNSGSGDSSRGPNQAYPAIGSRRDGTPGRDQAGLLPEGLAHFAGNRVRGSFRERRCHRQQKNCPVMTDDGSRGTGCSNAEIGQHLGCLPALAAFRRPQLLLARIARAGS